MSGDSDLDRLLSELKRRRVYKVTAIYVAAGFALLQGLDIVLPALDAPAWVLRACVLAILLGFPLTLVLAWVFDITPEGVERTADLPEGVETPLGTGARAVRVVLGLLMIGAMLTGAGLWLRPGEAEGTVRAGADVIAVLPFRTTGPDVGSLSEGMVDLLSTNLDQVGAIRTISPRRVLRAWEARADQAEIDATEGQVIGREVGAGSVLHGSVTQAGREARLAAELHSIDGSRLARATVRGPVDDVLSLVDSLSLTLLHEVWRSSEPVPLFDVSRLTTPSLDAIRAYLRGEAAYRRSSWPEAVRAYEDAVRFDSAFALAHVRLASAYGWQEQFGSPPARRHVDAARRLSARLPERDRRLVVATGLWYDGQGEEARDSLRAYVEDHPDDPDGWFLLGDITFHVSNPMVGPPNELYSPFERVIALDSTLTPALFHPLDLALSVADSARFHRYIRMMAAAEADPAVLEILRGASRLTWPELGMEVPSEEIEALTRRILEERPSLMPPLAMGSYRALRGSPNEVLDAALAQLGAARTADMAMALCPLLTALGRITEAEGCLARAETLPPGVSAMIRGAAVTSGFAPVDFLDAPAVRFADPGVWGPRSALVLGLLHASQGDAAAARAATSELGTESADRAGVEGWAALIEGDTVKGIERLADALNGIDGADVDRGRLLYEGLRYRLLDARARTQRDDVALEDLTSRTWADMHYAGLRHLSVAEIEAERGNARAAQTHYRRFLRIVERGGPSIGPLRERANAGLARLGM
jgi:tetratricopeptide (TPR) repeat protein/TolB-like protein